MVKRHISAAGRTQPPSRDIAQKGKAPLLPQEVIEGYENFFLVQGLSNGYTSVSVPRYQNLLKDNKPDNKKNR